MIISALSVFNQLIKLYYFLLRKSFFQLFDNSIYSFTRYFLSFF
nr:MAG TPA: hypothetical protein [Caudoviricetes sp.]